MINISKNANPNYLAKIVKLNNIRKHSNADRLQIAIVDFNTVITDLNAKEGDMYVYFPIECQINSEFISFINAFREKELNKDNTQTGFFEKNCRVRAVKLRNEKSMGFIIPIKKLEEFSGINISTNDVDKEFDTVNNILICKKYEVPVQERKSENARDRRRIRRAEKSRIIEHLINLHVDTLQLRKNIHKFSPEDIVSISYKMHGTSAWVSHSKVKRALKWYEKFLMKLRIRIDEMSHDYIYGSRKVIKNKFFEEHKNSKEHYYKVDVWADVKNELLGKIPEGFTVYGEIVGYAPTGKAIQPGKEPTDDYDYSCLPQQKKFYVYRITFTNDKGYVYNLSTKATLDFCERYGLETVPYLYIGKLKNLFPELDINNHWHENLIKKLEEKFEIESDCEMCRNKVPREGIVIRKETQFDFDVFKLKGFRFLERETKDLDKGITNIEDEN